VTLLTPEEIAEAAIETARVGWEATRSVAPLLLPAWDGLSTLQRDRLVAGAGKFAEALFATMAEYAAELQ